MCVRQPRVFDPRLPVLYRAVTGPEDRVSLHTLPCYSARYQSSMFHMSDAVEPFLAKFSRPSFSPRTALR